MAEELNLKAIIVIVLTSTLFRCVGCANITVGGVSGWDLSSDLHLWSSTATFNVGDDLVFIYTPIYDVIEVNQQGYDTCTIANAIATYDTGETVIGLNEPGTRYFVCGRLGHCQLGLKLEAQVLAQPNNNNNGTDEDDGNGDDPERRRGGRNRSPPRPISPPSPPRHRPPPPPRDDDDDDLPHPPPPPRDDDLPHPPPPPRDDDDDDDDDDELPHNPTPGPCSIAAENKYRVMMTLISYVFSCHVHSFVHTLFL